MDCIEGLKLLDDNSINCCVTSPPYWGLRNYGVEGQLGLEKVPDCLGWATGNPCGECYVCRIVQVFREVKRVLRDNGTLWLNLGDSYAGSGKGGQSTEKRSENWQPQYVNKGIVPIGLKPKDLVGIPWMVAFALRADGWYLRQDIIWQKLNPLPESVKDRCTKSHEYIFLLSKSPKYYYDYEAMLEPATGYDGRKDTKMKGSNKYQNCILPGQPAHTFAASRHQRWKFKNLQEKWQQSHTMHLKRLEGEEYLSPVRNKRSVWTLPTKPFKGEHFSTFPPDLIEPCILAGCPVGGIVLDPFMGSGTTAMVAMQNQRNYIGFEINSNYVNKIAKERLKDVQIKIILT